MATPRLSSVHSSVHTSDVFAPSRPQSPALGQLLARRADFHAYLRSRVGAAAADDLLQSAYLRLLERGVDLRDDAALIRWFYRVLRNAMIDHARKAARHDRLAKVFALQVPTAVQPGDSTEREQQATCTRQAVATLPAPQREAIEVVYLDGKSITELAQQHGTTKNTAAVRLHRARVALRDVLATAAHDPRVCLAA